MENLDNKHSAYAKKSPPRNSSSGSLSSCPATPVKKKFKTEHDKAQSIFDLKNIESHRAVVLDNQKLFQDIQQDTAGIISDFMKHNANADSYKQKLSTKENDYFIYSFIEQSDKKQQVNIKLNTLFNDLIKQLEKQSKDKIFLVPTIMGLTLQVGSDASHTLHKDNGSVETNDKQKINFDYTVVIPVLDYDLSGKQNHNFFPQSTQILPMAFKNLVPEHDKKKGNRDTVFYEYLVPSKEEEIKAHLVSEPLQQGTAIILHTATNTDSDDDGQSIIHKTPETPNGFARCFIIGRANKKRITE